MPNVVQNWGWTGDVCETSILLQVQLLLEPNHQLVPLIWLQWGTIIQSQSDSSSAGWWWRQALRVCLVRSSTPAPPCFSSYSQLLKTTVNSSYPQLPAILPAYPHTPFTSHPTCVSLLDRLTLWYQCLAQFYHWLVSPVCCSWYTFN